MNSRENMIRAIEFRTPERMPIQYRSFGMDDTYFIGWNQTGTGDNSKRESYDEWGCLWVRSEQTNMGQVKGHPLYDWASLKSYKWPDPDNRKFYDGMESRFDGSDGKYVLTGIFMLLFERMHSLRGFENVLLDFYEEPGKIEMLADRIVDFDIAVIKNISSRFPGQIDGLHFTDDWGSEQSTFISPALWDEVFKPRYKRIFDVCREAKWHIWMHSCGKINQLLPALLETGVNVLNLEQPRVLGIEEIGRKFAGRVCFSTGCDIQRTLPFKSEEEIREEAALLLDCWGTEKGGFILTDDGNGEALNIQVEKRKAMVDAFLKLDPWKRKK